MVEKEHLDLAKEPLHLQHHRIPLLVDFERVKYNQKGEGKMEIG